MRTWSNMVPKLIPLQELWIWTLWTVCHSLILRMGKMIVCVCVLFGTQFFRNYYINFYRYLYLEIFDVFF